MTIASIFHTVIRQQPKRCVNKTYIFLCYEYNHITAYTRTPQTNILRHHYHNTPRHTRTYVSPYYEQDINRTSDSNRINHTPHSPRLSQSSITCIKQYTFHVDTYRCILQHIIRILKIYSHSKPHIK